MHDIQVVYICNVLQVGRSALHLAGFKGQLNAIIKLVRRGAELDTRDKVSDISDTNTRYYF